MNAVLDDVRPNGQLVVLDEKAFPPLAPLKSLARDGAITLVSLDLTKGPLTVTTAQKLLGWLGMMNRATTWWIGDALNQIEHALPNEFSQIVDALGYSEAAARARMFVCKQIHPDRRKPSLGFSMHYKVARLSAREQSEWLNEAEAGQWTYAQLVAEMKDRRSVERLPGTDDAGSPHTPLPPDRVLEAARYVVAARRDYGSDWLVPREAMAQLAAAVGEEE